VLQKPGEHKLLPKPVYPLLDWLSLQGNPFNVVLKITDDTDEAYRILSAQGPDRPISFKSQNAGDALKGRAVARM
jgi:hypothetical protein